MQKKRSRKEVLIPGNLLPTPQPGRFHGIITATRPCPETGQQLALVTLSDEKIKLRIPCSEIRDYLLEQPGNAKKKSRGRNYISAAQAAQRFHAPPQPTGLGNDEFGPDASRADEDPIPEKTKPPPDPQRYGELLQARITTILSVSSQRWPLGAKLWLKLRGYSPWPVLMWSAQLCRKKDFEQLLATYKEGLVLVRCYGEHSSMWVRENDLEAFNMEDSSKFHQLKAWGRQHNKMKLVESVLEEVQNAIDDSEGEIERLLEIEKQNLLGAGTGAECSQCQEHGAAIACLECERIFHTLCVQPPALRGSDMPGSAWSCPFCGSTNQVGEGCSEEVKELTVERMGLTPDWIIEAASFGVFQLEPPSPERPYIKGLLDPCTNSMAAPNIPAEVLYDKQMNGLKLSNSWAGHLVLLNPPYTAATQWRFVNRAIDEVENDQVPAVLLLCRNSTDTAYFQRLRPYPRVLLRRTNTHFKDYSKTPIGFGICVFAIAKSSCRDLYARFFEAFADMGEPNIPIDKTIMRTDAFHDLLVRLRQHAEEHYRDHWVQCSICGKWRIITYEVLLAAKDADWSCRQLRPPYTSCRTQQTRREIMGGRYAVLGADGDMFDAVAERVDYSIPRLDLPVRQAAGSDEEQQSVLPEDAPAEASGEISVDAPGDDPQKDPPVAAPVVDAGPPPEIVAKFVKLPARPLRPNAGQQAPLVLSAIELARQARIAANRAYLDSLNASYGAIAAGDVAAVAGDNELVLSAARLLAQKAALAQAKAQVEQAKQHWAKASVSCAKEAARLQAALELNSEDMEAARSCVTDAEAALAALERQQAGKDGLSGHEASASNNSDGSEEEAEATDESSPPLPVALGRRMTVEASSIADALRASKSHLLSTVSPVPLQASPAVPTSLASVQPGGGCGITAVGLGTTLQAKLDLLPILSSPAFKRFVSLHPAVIAHTKQQRPPPALAEGQAVVVAQLPTTGLVLSSGGSAARFPPANSALGGDS